MATPPAPGVPEATTSGSSQVKDRSPAPWVPAPSPTQVSGAMSPARRPSDRGVGAGRRPAHPLLDDVPEVVTGDPFDEVGQHPVGRRGVVLDRLPAPLKPPAGEAPPPVRGLATLDGVHRRVGEPRRVEQDLLHGGPAGTVGRQLGTWAPTASSRCRSPEASRCHTADATNGLVAEKMQNRVPGAASPRVSNVSSSPSRATAIWHAGSRPGPRRGGPWRRGRRAPGRRRHRGVGRSPAGARWASGAGRGGGGVRVPGVGAGHGTSSLPRPAPGASPPRGPVCAEWPPRAGRR